jgi:hypothetical protein
MKTRAVLWVLLAVMLAAFAAIVSQKAIADGEHHGIPLPSSQFSITTQGSFAICSESCSTSGVLVSPKGFLDNGIATVDTTGNGCETFTEAISDLPVDASSPFFSANEHHVTQLLNYDSKTGTGDSSFTHYTGGTCNGATFDSTGAMEVSSGTLHFVVTNDGNRIDFLVTKLTNSTSSIGDFFFSETYLRQTRSES